MHKQTLSHLNFVTNWQSPSTGGSPDLSIVSGRGIPPERVGMNGEYDHAGLAKRVSSSFRTHYSGAQVENVRVTQRGRVVILSGQVSSWEMITELSSIALQIEGAAFVETYGLKVGETDRNRQVA